MKTTALLIVIICTTWLHGIGQLTISGTSPASGVYTACTNGNTTCSSVSYIGSTIKMRVFSISNTSIQFMIAPCSGSAFSTSGTAYLMSSTPCGTQLTNGTYSSGATQKTLTYNFTSAGTFTIIGVTITTGGARYYTNPITVTVTAPAPVAPTLSSPANNTCLNTSPRPTLSWNAVSGATNYRLYLYDNTNGNPSAITLYGPISLGNTTSHQIGTSISMPANHRYRWFVDAQNSSGTSPFSLANEFFTNPTPTTASSNSPVNVGATLNLYSNNTDAGSIFSWTGPSTFSSAITNPTRTNIQPTHAGNYSATVSNTYGCFFTTSTNVVINTPPSLTVTNPTTVGNAFTIGQTINVQWAYTGAITSNVQIELVNANNTALSPAYVIGAAGGEPIGNLSKSWTITNTNNNIIPGNQYRIKLYTNSGTQYLDYSDNPFTINSANPVYSCVQWQAGGGGTPTAAELNTEYATAFEYLCNKNVIAAQQFKNQIDNKLLRDQVAKVAYRALYTPNVNSPFPADNFPNIYPDLIPGPATYIGEAKALMYLEYRDGITGELDGISPFDRDKAFFNPGRGILRKFFVKVLLEAFNKKPTQPVSTVAFPAGVFTDVQATDETRGYLKTALDLGIITSQTNFGVADTIIRKDAFLMLYRLMKSIEVSGTYTAPAPALTHYFQPNNFSLANFNSMLGLDKANFNSYTKTSFGIAGLMPLTFAHTYNSVLTEMPNSYFELEPLGKGWTHNYNCYIQKVVGDDGVANGRTIIMWGDGTSNSFTENTVTNTFTPETAGTYATLTADAAQTKFTYKTKGQMVYEFTKFILNNPSPLTGTRAVWMLTKVADRNSNALTLTWTPFPVTTPTQIRLFKVTDPAGRYLQFTYLAADAGKIQSISAVTGSITRSVQFTYSNNNTDLASYTDPRTKTSTYGYPDPANPAKAHLLTTVTLPKSNTVLNTYKDRKLISSNFVGQYKTDIAFTQTYTAGNNTNFTQSTVTSTKASGVTQSTTIRHNALGMVRNVQSPTGNMNIDFANALQPTKPSSLSNSTLNIGATPVYDAMGNVTSVTKTGVGVTPVTETFTYNAFNDIATYTNGRGKTTTFTYNATGNLTNIKDHLNNNTVVIPNTTGTIQKVTNPAGIFTTFGYDAYGNTTSTSLQGPMPGLSINSSATYDDASRLTQSTDPKGVKTNMFYLENDMVSKVVADAGGLNNEVSYTYDNNDNLTTITNPKGGITTLGYNGLDQLTTYSFGGFGKSYEYNEDGTLKKYTNQNNIAFNFTYNPDGTLANDGYAAYTYDASNKNLKTITKGSSTLTYNYDGFNRVSNIAHNDFAANTVAYTYDANGNVTSIAYPGTFKVGYDYDDLDRLIRVYNFTSGSNYATYTYLADGRLSTQTNGNGTKTNYTYDVVGRLNGLANLNSSNANIASYSFTMDAVGNHLTETATEPNAPALINPSSETINYTHDAANRMNTRGSTTFTYNANGNNTAIAGVPNSTYTYDTKDNLLSSTTPSLACEYDAMENRRRKNNTRYVLDIMGGSNVLMETDLSGNATAYYIHGLGLVCRLDAAQANPAYYHYDYRGSTTAITNAGQAVTHSYRYGAFGENMGSTETFANPYRYVGKYGVQYEDNSLYFMRARYYNPMKGRFLGEDPVWGTNLYGYAGNNPVNFVDPSGNSEAAIEVMKNTFEILQKGSSGVMTNSRALLEAKMALHNLNQSITSTQADKELAQKLGSFISSNDLKTSMELVNTVGKSYILKGGAEAHKILNTVIEVIAQGGSAVLATAKVAGTALANASAGTIALGGAVVIASGVVVGELIILPQPEKALNLLEKSLGKTNGRKAWSLLYGIQL